MDPFDRLEGHFEGRHLVVYPAERTRTAERTRLVERTRPAERTHLAEKGYIVQVVPSIETTISMRTSRRALCNSTNIVQARFG